MNTRVSMMVALSLSLSLGGCKKTPPQVAVTPATDTSAATNGTDAAAGVVDPSMPVMPSEAPADRVMRVVKKSVKTLAEGDVTQARQVIDDLKKIAVDAPTKAEIPYNLGVAYELLGDETSARKSYLRATDIDPSLGEAWLNIGAMAESRGEYDRALQSYQAGLRYDAENPQLIVGVVGALRQQGRYAVAIDEAKKALGQNANNIDVYNNLGLIYLAQGQTDLASFVYQKALNSIDGADTNAYLHANLGRVYLAREETYSARQELERALELDARLTPAMVGLAQLHMDDHNWGEASALLERAREDHPSDAAILNNLGICYRGLGRYEESQKLYEQALDLDPRNPDPYMNLAVLQGDYMRAYDAALGSIDRYLAAGGDQQTLAEEWREELSDSKAKYEKELARKAKREKRDAKRAEEQRLALEYEAAQQKLRDTADAALGKTCPSDGCPEFTTCSRDGVCANEGAPGTQLVGSNCAVDDVCGPGLVCTTEGACDVALLENAVPEDAVPPVNATEAPPDGSAVPTTGEP